jgi:hypothetical protein
VDNDEITLEKNVEIDKTMEMVPIENSRNISGSMYDGIAQQMYLEFSDGSRYKYKYVPIDIYMGFLESESKGSFFHKEIKGKFECVKIKDRTLVNKVVDVSI